MQQMERLKNIFSQIYLKQSPEVAQMSGDDRVIVQSDVKCTKIVYGDLKTVRRSQSGFANWWVLQSRL